MGDQRRLFRFQLPWLSAPSTIRPAAQTETPSPPTSTTPTQRPPFRPAGSAPQQTTPTQAKAPARKTHQPAATEIRATSQTRSPSRTATQARAASVPPPSSRIVSQPQSATKAVSKQQSLPPPVSQPSGQTSPQPSSSRQATQAQTSSARPPSSASRQAQPFGVAVEPSHASVKERTKLTAKGSTHEQSKQRTTTKSLAATDAGTKIREQRQEGTEKKETLTTSSTDEKQIKAVTSVYPKSGSTPNHVSSNLEQVPVHKEIKEDISKFVHKLTTEQPKLATEEKPIIVLTLAGENRGASFHVGSESSKKDGSVHIHRGYKINPDDSPDATTDGEESSKSKKPTDSAASRTYANNNTQSVNNSIVFECSVNARDPGVHLTLQHNLVQSTKSSSAKEEHVEPRKAEFKVTPAEKLTHEPTVRRRCLRGLLAESSDSDPEKPRRHGCRYSCGGKNKQKEVEIF